jgi:hypothetical protein
MVIFDILEIKKPCKHLVYRVLVVFEFYSAEKEGLFAMIPNKES